MATDLREDVGKFAGRVLRRALWPHQIEAAKSPAFVTVVAAARRTGKTVLAETLAIHTAFANRGCRVLILSATQDAARRLTESIGATLNGQRLTRGAVVDAFSTRVRLANGSEIVSLPASQRQVRGYGEALSAPTATGTSKPGSLGIAVPPGLASGSFEGAKASRSS